jgi:hypothetical protein
MSCNRLWVDVAPQEAFAIVAEGGSYRHWVVGATDIEGVDPDWPAPGSTFRHQQARGPLTVHDTSTVLVCEPPHRLLLEVRARPWFVGEVDIRFVPERGGTRIEVHERATGGVAGVVPQPLLDPLLRARNTESIRRLGAMAWARSNAVLERVPG